MKQTELDAVNALLEVIEETTVQTIDLSHPDVQLALNTLANQSVSVQSTGWWFNKEQYQLTVDSETGEVFFPPGVLAIDGIGYVKRSRKLYDPVRHSFDFTGVSSDSLTVNCIVEWALEELPPTVYQYILTLCKIEMLTLREFDASKIQVLQNEAARLDAAVKIQNLKYSAPNRQRVNNAAQLLAAQYQR